MATQKTISEQLRAYNRMHPPREDVILRVRDNWDISYQPRAFMDFDIKQDAVENYLAKRVHNDNRRKAFA